MRIFATNQDIGSANAMVPALKLLQSEGIEISLFSSKEAPARQAFLSFSGSRISSDLERPQTELNQLLMGSILDEVRPNLVMVGIGTNPNGVEKLALRAAMDRGISTVVIVESWPHLWLANYGIRDRDLYLGATRVLVFDSLSRRRLLEFGFKADQVVITGNPENDELAVMMPKRIEIGRALRNELMIGDSERVFTYAVTNNLEWGRLDIEESDPRWLGFKESTVITEFLRAVEKAKLYQPLRGILRIKPGRERAPLEELVKKYSPDTVIVGEECRDGRQVILASDVVVGTTTIMLQTASFLDVLSVSYLPNLCRPDQQFANGLGIIKVIKSDGGLTKFLMDLAQDSERIRLEREALMPVLIQTNATRQVATAIKTMDNG